jgi:hypothetical protein
LKTELRYVGEVLNIKDYRTKLKVHNVAKNFQDPAGAVTSLQQQEFQWVPMSNYIKLYSHNGHSFVDPE